MLYRPWVRYDIPCGLELTRDFSFKCECDTTECSVNGWLPHWFPCDLPEFYMGLGIKERFFFFFHISLAKEAAYQTFFQEQNF